MHLVKWMHVEDPLECSLVASNYMGCIVANTYNILIVNKNE